MTVNSATSDTESDRKPWDSNLRKLVQADPQAFVSWFGHTARLKERAIFLQSLSAKLKTWSLEADALLQIRLGQQDMLLHLEFQARYDATMAERLLCYNVLLHKEHRLPVVSCVIYLLRGGSVPTSPLQWFTPICWNDETCELLRFHFMNIEVGKLYPTDLLALDLPGLLPLLPLTQNGATTTVVADMFEQLETRAEQNKEELLTVGSLLAALMFQRENPEGLSWLYRRLRQMREFLRESPLYQDILSEGLEKGMAQGMQQGMAQGMQQGMAQGMQQGMAQGMQQGEANGMRKAILAFVHAHYPALSTLAWQTTAEITDANTLQDVFLQMNVAKDIRTVQACLLKLTHHVEPGNENTPA
jgi:predicted transposase YdaD